MKARTRHRDSVNVVTLGCSKNLVDSEVMMGQLKANGIRVAHEDDRGANVVIVNTCGFIDRAKEESIETILHYAGAKTDGRIDKLYVTGCLSQRYEADLEREIPEVDAWYGTRDLPRLLKAFRADYKHELVGERLLSTPSHYAYMKISEGCNRTCAFCAIPLMRGKHRSRPIDELVAEARDLAANGVKELMLIAQELTFYGLDIYKKRRLPELLRALSEVDGIEWIRLHYAYPAQFPMEIIEEMARNPAVCNYLDIPLQHASDPVLARMKRKITQQKTRDLIARIRDINPGIAIRTTMLVGFPGETEDDFDELVRFTEDMRFERMGVFQYSHEENTSAYGLADDVEDETKARRAEDLMGVQQEVSDELNRAKVGQTVRTIIDKKEGGYFIGRTEFDSPEVDNEVLIPAHDIYLGPGEMVDVRIERAEPFDLYGRVV